MFNIIWNFDGDEIQTGNGHDENEMPNAPLTIEFKYNDNEG